MLRNKLLLTCESLLRVPPLLVMDEIFRYSFGFGLGSKSDQDEALSAGINISTDESSSAMIDDQTKDFNEEASTWLSNGKTLLSSFWTRAFAEVEELIPPLTDVPAPAGLLSPPSPQISSHFIHIQLGDWDSTPFVSHELLSLFLVLGSCMLFGAMLVIFLLSTENLIKLYSYTLSFFSLYLAFTFTPFPSFWTPGFVSSLLYNLFIRLLLATLYFTTRLWPAGSTRVDDVSAGIIISEVLDRVAFASFFWTGLIRVEVWLFLLFAAGLQHQVWTKLPEIYDFIVEGVADTKRVRNEFGISHLIQVETGRLRISSVFRLFWTSRAAYAVLYRFWEEPIQLIARHVMTEGTETLTGIMGLTAVVSGICHQMGDYLLWIIYYGQNTEADANRFGSISTVLFFILSLQTGLTSLTPEKRLDRLLKNVVLLGTALLHAFHQSVAPLLHAFRTFQALQIRAVGMAFAFLILSAMGSAWMIIYAPISTWSLAVLALAIEFKIKLIISLLIAVVVYFSQIVAYPTWVLKIVQMLSAVLPRPVWKIFTDLHDQVSHEDIVFYLKAFASLVEFFTGIFLFFNAVWIFLFESASAIRAVGMSIHAYFNIWCESKKGWNIYVQRRTASNKIMSLADATPEQLQDKRDDVCSICYEEMDSAKVTHCSHLFHSSCLRKWLYVQNNCPLCHEILYNEDAQESNSNPNPNVIAGEVFLRVPSNPNLLQGQVPGELNLEEHHPDDDDLDMFVPIMRQTAVHETYSDDEVAMEEVDDDPHDSTGQEDGGNGNRVVVPFL